MRAILSLALFSALASAAAAPALGESPTPAPGPAPAPRLGEPGFVGLISTPEWAKLPSGNDMARFYPERAATLGLSGRAVIQCMVLANGRLADCQVISESPPGEGFGAAALNLSSRFRMRPRIQDGKRVAGGLVRVPIRFSPPSASPSDGAPPPPTG